MTTAVVIPTYNEADNVARTVRQVLLAAPEAHVLVVDDASPDGTADVVRSLAGTSDRVALLARRTKEGLGPAYVDGFRAALRDGYDVVVQMDADGSHAADDLPRLLDAVDVADLAIGSRYIPGGAIEGWSGRRRLLSRWGNVYAGFWLPIGVRDLTGGFKAWRGPLLDKVLGSDLTTRGYGFQIETTCVAAATGARIVEVPITFRERALGRSKMTAAVAVEAALTVPRLRHLLAPDRNHPR